MNPGAGSTGGVESRPHLIEDAWERGWMLLGAVVLIVFAAALLIASIGLGVHLPGASGRVDPKTVTRQGPFASPGLTRLQDGSYVAYVVARTWAFTPGVLTVPQGAKVTFRLTSIDVTHGFKLAGTNVNVAVVPGQITEITATFDKTGEFTAVCNEYCGIGHARMFATLKVVPRGQAAGGTA